MTIKSSSPLLNADNLSKQYGSVQALDNATFEVHPGITGLLGPNGAGKSTAIRIFLGLTDATSGRAEIMGSDANNAETRTRLGYMPEHDCLPDNLSASYFLTLMAEVSGIPRRRARALAADTLRHVGLFEERYRPISTYSTGMKQRVKLAQSLVHDPVLILLDEPTAGLDPNGRTEMISLVRKIHLEFGINVVLSTHLMHDVERTCDRIVMLDNGRVAQDAEVAKLTEETQTFYVEVTANREQFSEALGKRGIRHSVVASSVIIPNLSGERLDAVRDALVESNAPLRRMAPQQRALIDIFRGN